MTGNRVRLDRTMRKWAVLFALWPVAVVAMAQQGARVPRIGYVMPTAATWAEAAPSLH